MFIFKNKICEMKLIRKSVQIIFEKTQVIDIKSGLGIDTFCTSITSKGEADVSAQNHSKQAFPFSFIT